MKALSWINFILGLWLIVAGFVLSRGVGPVMSEEIILGVIIACLAYFSTIRPGAAVSGAVAIAGLWTLIAPAVINYSAVPGSRRNDVILGIIVLALGFANAVYRQSPVRTTNA